MIEVDIYASGWLYALKYGGVSRLLYELRYSVERAREGNWRAVRQTFHGYCAEHVGCSHNLGTGWTRNRAARKAFKICMETSA